MVDIIKKRVWSEGGTIVRASFYGITENKKSANEHLTQTNHQQTLTFYQNSRMILEEM